MLNVLMLLVVNVGLRVEEMVVVDKGFDLEQDNEREVGIAFVNSVNSNHDLADLLEGQLVGQALGLQQIVFCDMEIVGATLSGRSLVGMMVIIVFGWYIFVR